MGRPPVDAVAVAQLEESLLVPQQVCRRPSGLELVPFSRPRRPECVAQWVVGAIDRGGLIERHGYIGRVWQRLGVFFAGISQRHACACFVLVVSALHAVGACDVEVSTPARGHALCGAFDIRCDRSTDIFSFACVLWMGVWLGALRGFAHVR